MKYKFVSRWDEETDISRWRKNRIELNKIIDCYNNWQIDDNFDRDKARIVLAKIEYGKQTIGSSDDEYLDELDEMEKFVNDCMSQ